jgi:hypothetical protein
MEILPPIAVTSNDDLQIKFIVNYTWNIMNKKFHEK